MLNNHFEGRLPQSLSDLSELALDLRWTTSQLTSRIWERLDPDAWEQTENPYLILLNASEEQLAAAATDDALMEELATWRKRSAEYHSTPTWFETLHAGDPLQRVAYFSMEFGLSEALPIYSGGLGLLAGDHLKSASDLGVPLVGIGILYQQGYFRQILDADGFQGEAYPFNDPSSLPVTPLIHHGGWHRVSLELPGRTLSLRVWQAKVGRVPLYLLDSNDPQNSPWDRGITASLYDAGRDKRLLQEIVLGIGGWRLLDQLGHRVDVCHLNEGHAAFAVLARAQSLAKQTGNSLYTAFRATRAGNVFTTHTPVAAAFDAFDPGMVSHYARPILESLSLPIEQVLALGRCNPHDDSEAFNMAFLAMRGCCHVNAVSKLHGQVSKGLFTRLYPNWPQVEIPVTSVTNGVHIPTWDSEPARRLWIEAAGNKRWVGHLESAAQNIQTLDVARLWEMRARARQSLVEYVRRRLTRQMRTSGASPDAIQEASHVLDSNALTLGFARRFTEYKRPNLLLRDAERLRRILLSATSPVQLIVAGKAHPNDGFGRDRVHEMAHFTMQPDLKHRIVFLEDYDMVLAQHLAEGVDVWLNTPRRPAEACGTSGMKMLCNGGLNLSVRDGWWDEAWSPEVGWQIGDGREDDPTMRDPREAAELLDVLEQQVIPEFYDRDENGIPQHWLRRVQASMSFLTPHFSSDRMVKEYVERAYIPAAKAAFRRAFDGAKLAKELWIWHSQLEQNWKDLHFGEVRVAESDGQWLFTVSVYLGEMPPEAVRVELFAEPTSEFELTVIPMLSDHPLAGSINGFSFTATVPGNRPSEHYTPRIVPWHPEAYVPSEESFILWRQ